MGQITKDKPRAVLSGETVRSIPAETRWMAATEALIETQVSTVKKMFDVVGREKYNKIGVEVWTEAGNASRELADALGLAGHDAASAARTGALVSFAVMGPEFQVEVTEEAADKAVCRGHECQCWNKIKKLGVSDDLCSAPCAAYWNASAKSFNPKLSVSLTKARPWGDAFCERVYQLGE